MIKLIFKKSQISICNLRILKICKAKNDTFKDLSTCSFQDVKGFIAYAFTIPMQWNTHNSNAIIALLTLLTNNIKNGAYKQIICRLRCVGVTNWVQEPINLYMHQYFDLLVIFKYKILVLSLPTNLIIHCIL